MIPISQPQEIPQIEVVVVGPDNTTSASDPSTPPFPVPRRIASFEQTRPMASSTSVATSSRYYAASSTEGTTLGNSSSQNVSTVDLKNIRFDNLEPIPASKVMRNDRKRTVPKPKNVVNIESGVTDFDYPQRDDDWVPYVHPDGALYFFDRKRRIYTDADLGNSDELRLINRYAQLLQQERETEGFPWPICELVLEKIDDKHCGYYFVVPGKRCICWLQSVPITELTKLKRVGSPAHIKYLMEVEYWTHCMLFPNSWSVTGDVVAELEQMVIHAVADCIPSTTSVIPFDQEELTKIFDLTDRLKGAVEEPFPHAKCVVARFMQDFASAKFFNFCGQPAARLNSDQSILSKSKPQYSSLIIILSLFLFWAPCDYARELDGIWVDKVINRVIWKQFIAKLSNDWAGLALYATVILNANVAFLALGGDTLARSFSFISTVTSVGVVFIGLMLVRQTQRDGQDSAERAEEFLASVAGPVLGMDSLAIIFSLPYALLLWSMVFFVFAFAIMVFGSAQPVTKATFGVAGGFVAIFVIWTARTTRIRNCKDSTGSGG